MSWQTISLLLIILFLGVETEAGQNCKSCDQLLTFVKWARKESQHTPPGYEKQIDFILSAADDGSLCDALNICNADGENTIIYCKMCTWVADATLQVLLSDSMVKRYEEELKQLCTKIESHENECGQVVDIIMTKLASILRQFTGEQMCSAIHMCNASIQLYKPLEISNHCSCDRCINMTDTAKHILLSPKVTELFHLIATNDCKLLNEASEKCDNTVEGIIKEIVQFTENTDSSSLCNFAHSCPEAAPADVCPLCKQSFQRILDLVLSAEFRNDITHNAQSYCSFLPIPAWACNITVQQGVSAIFTAIRTGMKPDQMCMKMDMCPKTSAPIVYSTDEECSACKYMMEELKEIVLDDERVQHLKDSIKSSCATVEEGSVKCEAAFNALLEDSVTFVKTLNDEAFCGLLGQCETTQSLDTCTYCMKSVADVESFLLSNDFENFLINKGFKACDHIMVPVSFCQSKIRATISALFTHFRGTLTPLTLCSSYMMCPVSNEFMLKDNTTCTLCESLVGEIHDLLTSPSFRHEVTGYVDSICKLLKFRQWKDKCEAMVSENIDVLLLKVAGYVNTGLCTATKLC